MGTQTHTGFGYGVKIPHDLEAKYSTGDAYDWNMWDEIESWWHRLDYSLSGDYWNQHINESLVIISSTFVEQSESVDTVTASDGFLKPSKEDEAELSAFIEKYLPGTQPQWFLWSYSG